MDKIKKLYNKYKEIINYLVFGVLTTVVSLIVYYVAVFTFLDPENAMQLQIANILSWFVGVAFAYVTNRKYVFESTEKNKIKEAGKFVMARVVTLAMDMLIMWLGVTILHFNDKIIKLISQVVIIISNYIFSKIFVFKKENKKIKQINIKDIIIKLSTIIFAILFFTIAFNAIFFNRAIYPKFSSIILFIGVIVGIILLTILYKTNHIWYNKLIKLLKNNKAIVAIMIFLLQLLFVNLIWAKSGWDCGIVLNNSYALYKGEPINAQYFAVYPNNLFSLIMLKYLFVIVGWFTNITAENYYFIAIIFNVILIDISVILTLLTCKKLFGNKKTLFVFLFIIPLILFFPNIIIPYTDTFSLFIPIGIFYFYLKIKDNTKLKYLYIFIEGILMVMGYLIKPPCVIMGIAIILVEIFYFSFKNIKNIKTTLINFIAMILIFILGATSIYKIYDYYKDKNISKYITDEMYETYSTPFTHFIMMGMSTNELAGKPVYGVWYLYDVDGTNSKMGQKAKKQYNLEVIKQRLHNFGIKGYVKFVYNKMNFITSDGTFYYWLEGNQTYLPKNQSKIAVKLQKFYYVLSKEYSAITGNLLEILWIILLIGIAFSYKYQNKNINILKLSILGIILFIVIFEGRSRYLYNYIPIFIIMGTIGLQNIIKFISNKLQIKEEK